MKQAIQVVTIEKMTKQLCRQFYKDFQMDPALYLDPAEFRPFVYEEAERDAYFERYQQLGRVHLAVMLEGRPIGEIVLKKMDWKQRCCTMGIVMQCDAYKNRGLGTQAERLALQYAFDELGLDTVYADAVRTNTRSQHVLEKVGFHFIREDKTFKYYAITKGEWRQFCSQLR